MTTKPVELLVLIERHFLADCCAGRSARYRWSFGAAVRLWAADLGRPPSTADLTPDAVTQFVRHLRHAGYGAERVREYRTRLRTLWEYAYRRGLAASPATVKVANGVGPRLLSTSNGDAPPEPAFHLIDSPAPPGTVRSYFQTVFAPQQLIDKSRSHVKEHHAALRSLWRHYSRDLDLAEQTDALAAEHFRWMKDRGQTNWAVNNIRKCWFAQWRHAAEAGLVIRPPMIRAFKTGRGAPDAWTIEEMKRILAVANPWWRALLLVGYWTLQRRRALLSIPAANVDLVDGWIDFPPASIKTDTGIRCRIGPDAVAAITALGPPRGLYLFEWRRRLQTLHDEFRDLLKRAGVRPSRRRNGHFHKLRRTGATHAVIRGGMAVVCDLLGQSSIYVTKRYIDKTQLPGHDVTRLLPLLMDDVPNGGLQNGDRHETK
jgi:hypothetical protein